MRDAPVSFREAAAGAPRRLRRVGMQATHRGSRPAAPCEIRQEHVLVMVGAPFGGHAWRLCQWHPTLRDVGRGSALGPSSNMSPFGRDSKLSFDGPRRQIPTHHESTRHNESKRACTRKKREAQPSRARLRGPACLSSPKPPECANVARRIVVLPACRTCLFVRGVQLSAQCLPHGWLPQRVAVGELTHSSLAGRACLAERQCQRMQRM